MHRHHSGYSRISPLAFSLLQKHLSSFLRFLLGYFFSVGLKSKGSRQPGQPPSRALSAFTALTWSPFCLRSSSAEFFWRNFPVSSICSINILRILPPRCWRPQPWFFNRR